MKKHLLSQFKQYKANLHTHTTVSDGTSTPEQVKEFYKAHGYSIIAFTDHEVLVEHSDLNDENFLSITGCEYANTDVNDKQWHFKTTCHLNFLAKQSDNTTQICYNPAPLKKFVDDEYIKNVKYHGEIFEREHTVECVNHVIAEANKHGFLVAMNHPWWSMEGFNIFSQYEGCFAVEVFNTACASMDGFYEFNPFIYDELLRMGKKVFPIAADDMHHLKADGKFEPEALGGFNMISSPSLSYSDVMTAIENGDFYASTGPIINEIYVEDGTLILEVEPCSAVFFRTVSRHGKYVYNPDGSTVTRASFRFRENDEYVYASVKSADGKWAITRAYSISEML